MSQKNLCSLNKYYPKSYFHASKYCEVLCLPTNDTGKGELWNTRIPKVYGRCFCRNVLNVYHETFIAKRSFLPSWYIHDANILTYYFMQYIDSIWYLVKPNHVWKCKVEVGCFWHPCLDILFMGVQWNEMKLTQNGTRFFLKEYYFYLFSNLSFHTCILPFLLFSSFWSSVLWCSVKFFTTATKTSQNFSNWSH